MTNIEFVSRRADAQVANTHQLDQVNPIPYSSRGLMSEATSVHNAPAALHHRSMKNYLLDRHFQLKYTGFLVGIALLLSAALGGLLWSANLKVIEQSQRAVEQGRATVKKGQ